MYTLDANIFARDANPRDPFYATCHALLERLASTAAPVIEPGLLLAEVAGAISRATRDPLRARVYLELLRAIPSLTFAPSDDALAEASAYLAADYALRGADAVYVATARQHNSALVTLDREVRERVITIFRNAAQRNQTTNEQGCKSQGHSALRPSCTATAQAAPAHPHRPRPAAASGRARRHTRRARCARRQSLHRTPGQRRAPHRC